VRTGGRRSASGRHREQVVAATGWDIRFRDDVATTDEPTATELDTLRALQAA
jgi:glutaconate CoA-transferase subunit B